MSSTKNGKGKNGKDKGKGKSKNNVGKTIEKTAGITGKTISGISL